MVGRQPNDGRGRLGGRQKGTPNKDKPLKRLLMSHSLDYFAPTLRAEDIPALRGPDGTLPARYEGAMLSQFDADIAAMRPCDRARLEVDVLSYHTPRMQAVQADVAARDGLGAYTERLARLASGQDVDTGAE